MEQLYDCRYKPNEAEMKEREKDEDEKRKDLVYQKMESKTLLKELKNKKVTGGEDVTGKLWKAM